MSVKNIPDNTPVLVASGQVVVRNVTSPQQVRSPVQLAADAVMAALETSGCSALGEAVDTLVMTRMAIDSFSLLEHPFGSSSKPPVSVAALSDLSPQQAIYSREGGQSPQRLINEFSASIRAGEHQCVVLCGGEATGAMKQALKHGWQLDWHDEPYGEMLDCGAQEIMNDLELQHHITFPPQVYALFENAWRHKQGLSVAEHRQLIGRLFSRFSDIAAANPYAQFPTALTSEFIANASADNFLMNEPYHKWMVAQDAVNQGAAVIMMSVGKARELNIPEFQWVFIHGHGDADDTFVSQRESLDASWSMKTACQQALQMADISAQQISQFDLYSCFPVAVLAACDALDIPWDAQQDLTVTGGLPFFGGAGNNYSMHAIAQMYHNLLASPDEFGLVLANGGYLTKASVGIYSVRPCTKSLPATKPCAKECSEREVLFPFEGQAVIESYSLVYKRDIPTQGLIVGRDKIFGRRVLAKMPDGDQSAAKFLMSDEPIGKEVSVRTHASGCEFFAV
ncbi:acetyl-CoA acetyltransferase [Maricurvus nonylphenolicus]|uniref:hypothetical protein n=1 Tax=Maricurvus nonylphenolicus TaxID=1008307 RepID=UPI0036F2D8EC